MHSPPHYMQSDRYHLAAATYIYWLEQKMLFWWLYMYRWLSKYLEVFIGFSNLSQSSCSHSANIEDTTHNYGEDRSWVQHDFYLNLCTFDWDQKSIWCWILHQFKFSYLTLSLLYYNPLIKLTFCLFMHKKVLAGLLWQKG